MPHEWSESFSQQRMEKCTGVFQQIINHWIETNYFECRIVADEPIEGKTLDELGKMYFAVGVGEKLTRLPFLDTLIVFKMLADHHSKRTKREGMKQTFTVKTAFTEDEAFALLSDIENKIGIEVQEDE